MWNSALRRQRSVVTCFTLSLLLMASTADASLKSMSRAAAVAVLQTSAVCGCLILATTGFYIRGNEVRDASEETLLAPLDLSEGTALNSDGNELTIDSKMPASSCYLPWAMVAGGAAGAVYFGRRMVMPKPPESQKTPYTMIPRPSP